MKLAEKQLSEQGCVPCKSGASPLKGAKLKNLSKRLGSDWKVVKGHHLERHQLFVSANQYADHVSELDA